MNTIAKSSLNRCSLFHFILRALPHWFFFTPKPSVFPPVPAHSPFISIIFGPNILCMLLHLLFAPPAAGEATRGYLHGGLLIDFVGQQSPVGRWKLVILDLLILGLQILVFGVTLERTKIKRIDESMGNTAELAEQERQDHDFEERGMLRPDSSIIDDVPLQDLQSSSARRNINIGDEERDDSLRQENTIETENQHPLDRYYTGEHIIAQLNLVDIVRTQWQISGRNIHPPDASASGVRAAVVAAAARRTLSYRINVGSQRRD